MTELDIEEQKLRLAALSWCEIAVDSNSGVKVDSPIYKAVTEGRDPGPGYSSCADLAHWMLFRMGVRSKWVNRKEHLGWKMGMNVSMLASSPVARMPRAGETLHRGDIMIVWSKPQGQDAHVDVIDNFDPESKEVHTWDYGQAAVNPDIWNKNMVEGCRKILQLHSDVPGNWWIGSRKVQKVLPLIEVLDHCRAKGELVAADDPDAWLTRIKTK